MRLLPVLFVAAATLAGSEAQARREFPYMVERAGPRIDRVDIIDKGIYRAIPKLSQQDEASPTGGVRALAGITLIKNTDTFKPTLGMHFGIRYTIRGFPAGARVRIKIVQHYPIAGLKNPRNQKATYSYEQTSMKVVGYPAFEGYHLGAPWELVPGIWSFEIWHEGRLLAEQKFELTAN
ncbi:MAG TPA: DUF3859 domain-containing protein [Pseudolabrys sp.]|nr:DUF3859 domain-containing protein [Pseudolabrys sp.]